MKILKKQIILILALPLFILGQNEISDEQFIIADVNDDSTLNILDVIMIVNIIL